MQSLLKIWESRKLNGNSLWIVFKSAISASGKCTKARTILWCFMISWTLGKNSSSLSSSQEEDANFRLAGRFDRAPRSVFIERSSFFICDCNLAKFLRLSQSYNSLFRARFKTGISLLKNCFRRSTFRIRSSKKIRFEGKQLPRVAIGF